MIIIDTREQLPLDFKESISLTLSEGDYTTLDLYHRAHIERKSGIDLYGSLIQGHSRLRNEIQRAIDKNIVLAIFVECPKETFISKRFKGGYRLKTPPSVLRKIIATMESKYCLQFVWCKDRADMKSQMLLWFSHQKQLL